MREPLHPSAVPPVGLYLFTNITVADAVAVSSPVSSAGRIMMEGTMIEYRARGGLEYHNSPLGGTTMAECNDYSMQRHEDMKHCYSNPGTPPTLISIVSPQPIKVGTLFLFILSVTRTVMSGSSFKPSSGEFVLLPDSPTLMNHLSLLYNILLRTDTLVRRANRSLLN